VISLAAATAALLQRKSCRELKWRFSYREYNQVNLAAQAICGRADRVKFGEE
jgi:hypothetical protein